MSTISSSRHALQLPPARMSADSPAPRGWLRNVIAVTILAACLALPLAHGFTSAQGMTHQSAAVARAVTPLGICGGGVGTPC